MDKVDRWWAGVLSFSLLVSACSQTTPTAPTPRFIAWSQADRATPKRICVLPFADKIQVPGLTNQVRQSVAGHLSIKHFADAELHEIDSRLETLGPEWQTTPAQDLGRTLSCNALVYGEVTRASRLYLALYSQLTLEANILLVDTETGQTLLQETYATKFRSADIPLSPLSIVPYAVKNLNNLSDVQMIRAVDDLGRNLANTVPDLPALPTHPSVTAVPSAPPNGERPSPPQVPTPTLIAAKNKLPAARTVAQLESSTFDVPPTDAPLNDEKAPGVAARHIFHLHPAEGGKLENDAVERRQNRPGRGARHRRGKLGLELVQDAPRVAGESVADARDQAASGLDRRRRSATRWRCRDRARTGTQALHR